MPDFLKRTWAEIHLDRLDRNLAQLRRTLPPQTRLMSVVKADGYGHGDRMIARRLEQQGVRFFAVSNLEEALSLRKGGITSDILVLGFTPTECSAILLENRITQTVFSLDYARELNRSCPPGTFLDCHLKLDTGMTRIGIQEDGRLSSLPELREILKLPRLHCLGLFSHFSSADALDPDSAAYTAMQEERYRQVAAALEQEGVSFCRHIQNSAGIAFLSERAYDYVRAGIIQYGVAPSTEPLPFPLEPVMELKTVVSMVKEIPADTAVSYGRTFYSSHPMKLATVPIGYADGYPRLLSNRAEMLIHGKPAPVCGNICMDQLMLDVTGIEDVHSGDLVTVVGRDGSAEITFADLARRIGTISYELMCLIGRRVPRVYFDQDKMVGIVDYIQQNG